MTDCKGWIVCLAGIVNFFIRGGIIHGFGAFIAEFNKLYHSSMAELGKVIFCFILYMQ